MLLIDGHLDLAMNALDYERDQLLDVAAIRARETPLPNDDRGISMVSLPELRAGGTAVVVATVIARAKPWIKPDRPPSRDDIDSPSADMAHAKARGQLAYYELLEKRGQLALLRTRTELDAHWHRRFSGGVDAPLGVILMMEGADPVTAPAELGDWHARGLRCLSLAHFGHSRYACGTPPREPTHGPNGEADGPLTPLGRELLREMSMLGVALDVTHLSDTSLAEALNAFDGPVCATHSNCRALSDTPRQLTDEQLRRIIERDGVIGTVIHNGMLRWRPELGGPPPREEVTLEHVADHVMHICELAGSARHVAIGSDLDGGYGRTKTPRALDTHRDLHKLSPVLRARGMSDADVEAFFHGNWLRFWRRVLPA